MESISNPKPATSILLVEDEAVTLELLAIILPKKFPDVALHTAINGRTGLELFKSHLPDIVITDINMPQMDGVQMVQNIREIKTGTKFIVITGKSEKTVLQASSGNGFEFDYYIVKPVVFQELFAAIEQCIGELALQNYKNL